MIQSFLDRLDSENVNYVHWKSNTNILKALSGIDDLDILVSPLQKKELFTIFHSLGIIRAYSNKDNWQNEIFHFYGMDCLNKKLLHIHLHFSLEVGYDYDKRINLPIVENYIENRSKFQGIFLPEVEKEYIILIIRLLLKNSVSSLLLMQPVSAFKHVKNQKKGVVTGSAYKEYEDLRKKINNEKVYEVLKNVFPFIKYESFRNYELVLNRNNSVIDYYLQSNKLQKELQKYSAHGVGPSFIYSFYRLNMDRVNSVLRNERHFKKSPSSGGKILAFVGGDGAGKTTNIKKLNSLLSKHFYTRTIHLGRPNYSIKGMILLVIGKFFKILKAKDLNLSFNYLAVAYSRNKAFKHAVMLRNKGCIVILDRLPLDGITSMDCPRISSLHNPNFSRISNLEKKLYNEIDGIDDLIVLKLKPKIALERRPEDNPEELMIRSGQIWEKDFTHHENTHVINTNNSMQYVESKILKIVWNSLKRIM